MSTKNPLETRWRVLVGHDPRLPDGITVERWSPLLVDGAQAAGRPEGWVAVMTFRSARGAADALRAAAEMRRDEAVTCLRRAETAQSLAEHIEGLGAGEQISVHQAGPLALEGAGE